MRTRERTRVRTQLRPCEGSHVCACVRMCVRLWARRCSCLRVMCVCMCLCMHVRVGACAFAGVGQHTCGLCVRACVRVYMHV